MQKKSMIQKIGACVLAIMIGSSLDWIVTQPYIQNYINQPSPPYIENLTYLSTLSILGINLGMIARVTYIMICQRQILIQRKLHLLWVVVVMYPICWMCLQFCQQAPPLVIILPIVSSFLIGLVMMDPIERVIEITSVDDKEKNVCFIVAAVGFGSLLFSILIQFIFNPSQIEISPNIEKSKFQNGCFFLSGILLLFGIIGAVMQSFLTEQEKEQQDEFELGRKNPSFQEKLSQQLMNKQKKRDGSHMAQSLYNGQQRLSHGFIKKQEFFITAAQLYFMYNCTIGSMSFIYNQIKQYESQNQQKNEQTVYLIYQILCGLSLCVGQMIPGFFSVPFSQKTIFAFIQLLQMLALTFIAYFGGINTTFNILAQVFAFGLLGCVISIAFLALSVQYDWSKVTKLYPFIFFSLTLASITQFLLRFYAESSVTPQGILLINQLGMIAAFLLNIFFFDQPI